MQIFLDGFIRNRILLNFRSAVRSFLETYLRYDLFLWLKKNWRKEHSVILPLCRQPPPCFFRPFYFAVPFPFFLSLRSCHSFIPADVRALEGRRGSGLDVVDRNRRRI